MPSQGLFVPALPNIRSWALERHLREEGDAGSADVVFQYMTLGEVVYG